MGTGQGKDRRVPGTALGLSLCCRATHLPRQANVEGPCPSAAFLLLTVLCTRTRTRTLQFARVSCESCGILGAKDNCDAGWCKLQHPIPHASNAEVLR
jgi:hypothetical protein